MCFRVQSVRLDSDLRTFFKAQWRQSPAEEVIDRNTMPPGGNPQINKSTGEGVAQEEIIKGIQVDDGEYLVLTKKGNPDGAAQEHADRRYRNDCGRGLYPRFVLSEAISHGAGRDGEPRRTPCCVTP